MKTVKYSFVVPIYNVEDYLHRCLNSILAQTYKDYEIILVDDGSTDRSRAIADEYGSRYPEQICVEHQTNSGQGVARNKGIALAQGEYIVMVDSDDYISEKLLETANRYLDKYEDDILIFNYIVEEADGSQRIEYLHHTKDHSPITQKEYIFEAPAPWNKIFKADLFKNTDVRFPERIFYEDLAMSPCMALHATHIGVVEEALYYYVQRESSTMHTQDVQRMLDICPAIDKVLQYFKENRQFEEFYPELEYLTVSNVLCSAAQRILCVSYDLKKIKLLEQFVEKYFKDYENNKYLQRYLLEQGSRREKRIVEKKHFELYIGYLLRKIKRKLIHTR